MSRLFLAPNGASIEYTRKNFETILYGRPYDFVEPFLSSEEKEILSKHKLLRVWGVKEWFWSTWFMMNPGDFVLFYERRNFCYSAQVIITKPKATKTEESQQLAKRLWPDGEKWPFLFFVDNLKRINLSLDVINQLAGYKLKKLEPFIPLNDKGLKAITEKFGSIENFINQHTIQ